MKPLLCLALLAFVACAAMLRPASAATGPAMVGPVAPASLAPVCERDADMKMPQFALSFPTITPPEQGFSLAESASPDCRAAGGSGFTSVVARAQAGGDYRWRDYWLAGTRLLPSYPDAGSPAFVPPGWHWIELDR